MLNLCVIWYCEIAVIAKLQEFVWGYLRYALENTNTTKFSIKIPYLTSMVYYLLSVRLLSRFMAIGKVRAQTVSKTPWK